MDFPNLLKKPFKFDITEEFNELKEDFTCEVCHRLINQPVTLNTCGHTQCESCLDKRKLVCSICKSPYNQVDIAEDIFTESVLQSIYNIENIFNRITNQSDVIEDRRNIRDYEICITQTSMKRNPKGETPLHVACRKGNIATVEELIKSGVDINATDWANWAPIHEAVQGNHYNCVKYLLENRALINIPGADYISPLHKSISYGIDNITELLLEYGADKTATDQRGFTPMDYMTHNKLRYFNDIQEELKYTPKVYFNKEISVYAGNIKRQVLAILKSNNVAMLDAQEYKKKDNATHLIVPGNELNLDVLFGIAKGIFIVTEKWTEVLPLQVYPYEYIVEPFKIAVNKSIENKLMRKPKLFDGINFYVLDHEESAKNHRVYLNKNDLIMLIVAAGGKIMARAPALRTVEMKQYQPYHAKQTITLKECCNYIIFNEKKRPELLYNMKELRHKSSKWLIECILKFKIDN